MQKIIGVIRDAWLIAGITLLILVLLEISLGFALSVRARLSSDSGDHRVRADAYPDGSWAASYYDEFARSQTVQWKSYVYWRQQPFQGKHINVTAEGLRFTPHPTSADQVGKPKQKILMFGGSTLWGTGTSDSKTIPALLARQLANNGMSVEIINFGESGYVSTQEVISVLLELRRHTPDLVIFYDGVNDTFSGYQQGAAGLPQNESHRVSEFGLLAHANRAKLREAAFRATLQDLHTVRIGDGILRRMGVTKQQDGWTAPKSKEDQDALASGVVATYASNVRLVSTVAEQHGFKALFYWQPTIFQKRNLTKYEQEARGYAQPLEKFFLNTYALVHKGKAGPGVRDLSLVFSDVGEALYVDWCHLGERGNSLIAQAMADDVLSVLRAAQADKMSRPVGHEVQR